MHLKVTIDPTGFQYTGENGVAEWQSVTDDVMRVQPLPVEAPNPALSDIEEVRQFYT